MSGGIWIKGKYQSVATAAAVSTSTTAAIDMGIGDCYMIAIEVTAASGTSPTLDIVVQSALDGTNYKDLPLRFTQKTTTSSGTPEYLVFRLGLGENEVALAQVSADTGGQLAKNCLFNPNLIKLKYTIAGTSPSFDFTAHIITLPVQRRA